MSTWASQEEKVNTQKAVKFQNLHTTSVGEGEGG